MNISDFPNYIKNSLGGQNLQYILKSIYDLNLTWQSINVLNNVVSVRLF